MSEIVKQATRAQHDAANPQVSSFISANAGSGKTKVLTDRIARLLLRGVDPARILCVTFTKAAAGEVQNRIFKQLGNWTLQSDDELRAELSAIGEARQLNAEELAQARRLFAKALETPGGLKVQTIHAFAASVLKRFPLEAGISPNFTQLDEFDREELVKRAFAQVIKTEPASVRAASEIVSLRDTSLLSKMVDRFVDANDPAALATHFGLAPPMDKASQSQNLRAFWQQFQGTRAELKPALAAKWAEAGAFIENGEDEAALFALRGLLYTAQGAPTKAVEKMREAAGVGSPLDQAFECATTLVDDWARAIYWQEQFKLHQFGFALRQVYERLKSERGALDYNDLVDKCADLISSQDRLNWVMYRLDGGIEHILVDEAQDTNPNQWRIVDALVSQFSDDPSAARSVFVVGDYKQSIYGFQGAQSDLFIARRDDYSALMAQTGQRFHKGEIVTSFRSSPVILDFVDHCFTDALGEGVGKGIRHIAAKTELPGSVELWPYYEIEKQEKPVLWPDGVIAPKQDTEITLARDLANMIKREIDEGRVIFDGSAWRAVRPGDYLVLTRKRTKLYAPIQNELQRLNVPIAGVDKLNLSQELAVRDVLSVLRYVNAPYDEFSLACFLKSSICGLDDKDLLALVKAHGKGRLMDGLRKEPRYQEIVEMLDDLAAQAPNLTPFDLISRFLTRYQIENKLRARLGTAVHDALSELRNSAIDYERRNVATLSGFLNWFDGQVRESKRKFDPDIDAVRVMSMHGAKGLEAPIVIVPMMDGGDPPPSFIKTDEGVLKTSAKAEGAILPLDVAARKAEVQLRNDDEQRRLLYVALTRARSRLVIACAGGAPKEGDGQNLRAPSELYAVFQSAIKATKGTHVSAPHELGDIETVSHRLEPDQTLAAERRRDEKGYIRVPPIVAPPALRAEIGLSEILAPYTAKQSAENRGAQFGTLVHSILENWRAAQRLDDPRGFFDPSQDRFDEAYGEAQAVIARYPEIAAQQTIFERSFALPILRDGKEMRLTGRIDAIVFEDGLVRVIDFKTETAPVTRFSELPLRYQQQLAVYQHVIAQSFPENQVTAEIIWSFDQSRLRADADFDFLALRSALGIS